MSDSTISLTRFSHDLPDTYLVCTVQVHSQFPITHIVKKGVTGPLGPEPFVRHSLSLDSMFFLGIPGPSWLQFGLPEAAA